MDNHRYELQKGCWLINLLAYYMNVPTILSNNFLFTRNGVPLQTTNIDITQKTKYNNIVTNTPQQIKQLKKYYGNSTNQSASIITEQRGIAQNGKYFNTLPIKTTNNTSQQYQALHRIRNSGSVIPKKCTNNPSNNGAVYFNG